MLKRALKFLTLSLVGLVVMGCSSLDTLDTPPVPSNAPIPHPGFTFPLVDLANSIIPLPNDLLRDPVTGNLAFPGTGEPFDAANSLNGFSTSGAIIIPFRGTVVESSVTNDTLVVYNATTGQPAPCTFSFSTTSAGTVVTAVPIHALDHSTQYIVVTSSGIISALSNTPILSDNAINLLKQTDPLVDGNGNSTNAALDDATAAALEAVRAPYQAIWQGAEQLTGQPRANIPLAFAFTTQTLFATLPQTRADVVAANLPAVNANPAFPGIPAAEFSPVAAGHTGGENLNALGVPTVEQLFADPTLGLPPGIPNASIGRIHFGTITAPIYRTDAAEGFWSNPPVQQGTQTVPFVVFLPNAVAIPDLARMPFGPLPAAPANVPIPTVIFQHGITGNKLQSVALANAVNSQGLALIAIDLELHGDLKADPGASDGDGFINIPNLRNSRDNILQSVVNLYALNQAMVSGQTNIDAPALAPAGTLPELAPGPGLGGVFPAYVSLSLGSIVGDVFHATEPNLTASALNVGGARISNLLLQSETFSDLVIQGLAANGVQQGTPSFAQFFLIAQAVVDDADPVNYADEAISGTLRGGASAQILQQVNVTDAVVPPVSQYDMAIQHAHGVSSPAFVQVDALVASALAPQASSPYAGPGFYEIPNAGHGAILDPSAGPTVQIVTQALNYLGTALGGTGTIIDSGIRARQIPVEILESTDYSGVVKF
jgi:hypothetical protein